MHDILPIWACTELRALEAINTTVNSYYASLRILEGITATEACWLWRAMRQDDRAQRRRLMYLQMAKHARINIHRHSRWYFICACKALLPAAP